MSTYTTSPRIVGAETVERWRGRRSATRPTLTGFAIVVVTIARTAGAHRTIARMTPIPLTDMVVTDMVVIRMLKGREQ